ncbi:MAG TPA: methyltransferase, TIGR04325 family [Pyrinomonadaceae bacterium]|nr:methyltransferase, TIGR04325 family [Pyrinomonadaceae bacterium]
MKGSLEFDGDNDGIRFHVVVLNFERIASFLDNSDKLLNFSPDRDRLIVLDCSVNHDSQKQLVLDFARERGWKAKVIRRKNWGIDQGARVDYFSALRKMQHPPRFIWQFQEHYLDLESPWSIWPKDHPQFAGQLKQDTIPDDLAIDLDRCEEIYDDNSVSVLYADRAKLGIFTHVDGNEWFYADGANFSARTSDVLDVFQPEVLSTYASIYDGSYNWTLFMEMDICRRLTRPNRRWFDLVTGEHFADPQDVRRVESEKNVTLHQDAESFYSGLYRTYEDRFGGLIDKSNLRRRAQALRSSIYLRLYHFIRNKNGTRIYETFEQALAHSNSYEDPRLIEVVREKTKLYRAAPLVESKQTTQNLSVLKQVEPQRPIDVLEVGGACGASYFELKHAAPDRIRRWSIVETPAMAAAGNSINEDPNLSFHSDLTDAAKHLHSRDLAIAQGVLQYASDPVGLLKALFELKFSYVYITRTAVADVDPPIFINQETELAAHGPGRLPNPPDGNSTQPMTLISAASLLSAVPDNYEIVSNFVESEDRVLAAGNRRVTARDIGFLARLQSHS